MILGLVALPLFLNQVLPPAIVTAEASSLKIEEPKTEILVEQIVGVAENHSISTTTLFNLSMSESTLGENRIGDNGKSCGVIHFHRDYYPEDFAKCEDDEYILNRAADMIANGEEYKFTPCNCVSFVKVKGVDLPQIKDLKPNSSYPRVGGVVIFDYPNAFHVAYVEKVTEDGIHVIESNYESCAITRRIISFDDSNIVGYWSEVP